MMKTTDFKKRQMMLQKNQKEYNKQFFVAIKECVSSNKELCLNGLVFQGKKSVGKIITLIRKGADINATDENGDNALSIVLKGEEPIRTDVLKILLYEKDIEIQDNVDTHTQKTILERTAEIENHNDALLACKRLVKKGAVIQDKEKGIDAVYFAYEACNDKLVSFFENELHTQANMVGEFTELEQQLLGQD